MKSILKLVFVLLMLVVNVEFAYAQAPCVWPNDVVLRGNPARQSSTVILSAAYRVLNPGSELGVAACTKGTATFHPLTLPAGYQPYVLEIAPAGRFVMVSGTVEGQAMNLIYPLSTRVTIEQTAPVVLPTPPGKVPMFYAVTDEGEALGSATDLSTNTSTAVGCSSVGCRDYVLPGHIRDRRSSTFHGAGQFPGSSIWYEPFLVRNGLAFRSGVLQTWTEMSSTGNTVAGYDQTQNYRAVLVTTNLEISRPATWFRIVPITTNGTTAVLGAPTGVLERTTRNSDVRSVYTVFYQPWYTMGPRVWTGMADGKYPIDLSFAAWYSSEAGGPLMLNGAAVTVSDMIGVHQSGSSLWMTLATSAGYALVHLGL